MAASSPDKTSAKDMSAKDMSAKDTSADDPSADDTAWATAAILCVAEAYNLTDNNVYS